MELKRNYLTSDELVGIVNELVQHESAVEREIIKVGMVAQCLIDEMDEYKDAIIQNEAHKIIYSGLYRKFKELLDNKNRFIDESENLYKDAVQKYENG